MGFYGNLSPSHILNQYRFALKEGDISNIVFMGMGEPLDNPALFDVLSLLTDKRCYALGARRITVSTVGLLKPLEEFLSLGKRYRLALSFHSPFSKEREKLIPAERTNPLRESLALIRRRQGDRRVSFEYTLIDGVNDSERHAVALGEAARTSRARVNLLVCSKNPGGFASPFLKKIEKFRKRVVQEGAKCTLRESRGSSIDASCGSLIWRQ